MPNRGIISLRVYLALTVAPAALSAQTATGVVGLPGTPSHPGRPFGHDKELVAVYDSLADSTHLALVTHKGKYFLWVQRPRLTWSVIYAGQTPEAAPSEIVLEFRTQNPQVALDSRLIIEMPPGAPLEVPSVKAYSDPGAMTWSHFLRFALPTADLARALLNPTLRLSVGGIRVDFKPDELEAVRDLLSRVRAWPPASESGGA
jgi:hypothetical protein